MTWAVKLIEKKRDIFFGDPKDGELEIMLTFDDLVLAVLEKNKEIAEEVKHQPGKLHEIIEFEEARAFRELVEEMEKVKKE